MLQLTSTVVMYVRLSQKKHLDLAQTDSNTEEIQRAHVQLGRFYLSEHERLDGNWRGVRMLKLAKQHFHESLKLAEKLNLPIEKVGYLEHKQQTQLAFLEMYAVQVSSVCACVCFRLFV